MAARREAAPQPIRSTGRPPMFGDARWPAGSIERQKFDKTLSMAKTVVNELWSGGGTQLVRPNRTCIHFECLPNRIIPLCPCGSGSGNKLVPLSRLPKASLPTFSFPTQPRPSDHALAEIANKLVVACTREHGEFRNKVAARLASSEHYRGRPRCYVTKLSSAAAAVKIVSRGPKHRLIDAVVIQTSSTLTTQGNLQSTRSPCGNFSREACLRGTL